MEGGEVDVDGPGVVVENPGEQVTSPDTHCGGSAALILTQESSSKQIPESLLYANQAQSAWPRHSPKQPSEVSVLKRFSRVPTHSPTALHTGHPTSLLTVEGSASTVGQSWRSTQMLSS